MKSSPLFLIPYLFGLTEIIVWGAFLAEIHDSSSVPFQIINAVYIMDQDLCRVFGTSVANYQVFFNLFVFVPLAIAFIAGLPKIGFLRTVQLSSIPFLILTVAVFSFDRIEFTSHFSSLVPYLSNEILLVGSFLSLCLSTLGRVYR